MEKEEIKRIEAELEESKKIVEAIRPIINGNRWGVVMVALTDVISDVINMSSSGYERKKAFDMITTVLRAVTGFK